MVEIALLRQFFGFSAGTAAAEGPLKRPERLPGDEMKLHSMVEIALLVQFFGLVLSL